MQRLRGWLTKHQEENLVDSGKQRLIACVETYFKFALAADPTFESPIGEGTQNLISDLLKLPEGKLIRNSGGKSKALKWLSTTQGSGSSKHASTSTSLWTIADVSHDTVQLMSGGFDSDACDETRELIVTDRALLARWQASLDQGLLVEVELDSNDTIVNSRVQDA
jgi:hypothetical protein